MSTIRASHKKQFTTGWVFIWDVYTLEPLPNQINHGTTSIRFTPCGWVNPFQMALA